MIRTNVIKILSKQTYFILLCTYIKIIQISFTFFKEMDAYQNMVDYRIIRKLGEGSFGEVMLGEKNNNEYVAIKKISKEQIIKVNKLHEPFIEKEILFKLNQTNQNFFVKILSTHSDQQFVYLILELCDGGSLEDFIKQTQFIEIQVIRKVIVRIICILESLHSKSLIHRDLKPSNFLLTKDGYIKLSDFGTCYAPQEFYSPEAAKQIKSIKDISENKKLQKVRKLSCEDDMSTSSSQRRYTFVGTACYMSPELLSQDKCGKESDLWALGCIAYQMLHKKSPFFDESQGMIWTKILNTEVQVYSPQSDKKPISQEQKQLQNLIQQLLVKENEKRLGYGPNGYQKIQEHSFFDGVNWKQQGINAINQIKSFAESHITKIQLSLQKKKSDKEKVLFSSVVGKKAYFGNYKDRTLILLSQPKLVYYDTDTGQKKGEIILSKNTPVKCDGKYFQVGTNKKTYYFKAKQSNQWVQMIKYAILNAFY